MENIDLKPVETVADQIKHCKYESSNEIKTINDARETILNVEQEHQRNTSADFEQVFIKDIKTEVDIENDLISANFNNTEQNYSEVEYGERVVEENVTGPENVKEKTPEFTFVNITEIKSELDGSLFHNTMEENQATISSNKISNLQLHDIDNNKVKKIRRMRNPTKNLHECCVCHKVFNTASHLRDHMRIHTGEKPYECDICNRKFSISTALTRHVKIHSGEKPYECDICKRKFSITNDLTRHMRIHSGEKPFECGICKKSFTQSNTLVTHIRTHSGEKPYECEICKKKFTRSTTLTVHMRIHKKVKQFVCDVCNKIFTESNELTKHMRIHTASSYCEFSNKIKTLNETTLNVQQELQRDTTADFEHVLIENIKTEIDIEDDPISASFNIQTEEYYSRIILEYKDKDVQENVTGPVNVKEKTTDFPFVNITQIKSETDRSQFHNTMEENQTKISSNRISNLQLHGIVNRKVEKIRHMRNPTKNSHECSVCNKKFNKAAHLRDHMRIHTGEKPYGCDICKRKFSVSTALTRHVRIHSGEKPHECDICKRKFSILNDLTKHMRIHSGEKPFECDICNKAFAQSNGLRIHIKTHNGEKPYECEICKKKCSRLSNLTAHMKIHRGDKQFICDICKRKFTQANELTNHMRIHTGDKPYECSMCKKTFNRSSNLRTHMRIHSGEKPFECNVCKKKFSQSAHLTKHMIIHTGTK